MSEEKTIYSLPTWPRMYEQIFVRGMVAGISMKQNQPLVELKIEGARADADSNSLWVPLERVMVECGQRKGKGKEGKNDG